MMKIYLLTILFVFLCSCENNSSVDTKIEETPLHSEHLAFKLYDGLSFSIAEPIIEKVESSYQKILNDMAVASIPKITVEIWNDEKHFQDDMKKDIGINYPGALGYVYDTKTVRLLNRGNLAQNTLHEFSHIVSLYVNRNFSNNPRWLWEAVAIYEAGEFIHPKNISYLAAGNFPSIRELNSDFNVGDRKIYEVGYIVSEYIIAQWGKESFVKLIKLLGDVDSVLGVSELEFETGWKKFVAEKYF